MLTQHALFLYKKDMLSQQFVMPLTSTVIEVRHCTKVVRKATTDKNVVKLDLQFGLAYQRALHLHFAIAEQLPKPFMHCPNQLAKQILNWLISPSPAVDSFEPKNMVTRKLRRRHYDPMPTSEKRRKVAPISSLVYVLEDNDVEEDIKMIFKVLCSLFGTMEALENFPSVFRGQGNQLSDNLTVLCHL